MISATLSGSSSCIEAVHVEHDTAASASERVCNSLSGTAFSIDSTPAACLGLISESTVFLNARYADGIRNTERGDAALLMSADPTRCCRWMRSKSLDP